MTKIISPVLSTTTGTLIAAFAVTTLVTGLATVARAESKIETLCGASHINEILGAGDIHSNPDGFYVHSLAQQVSHGDPRIISAVGKGFHLCTTAAATPDMEANRALLLQGQRRVKYLFVPTDCPQMPPSPLM